MTLRQVPLFWVCLAFATGCLLGLDRVMSWPVALGCAVALGVVWIFVRKERASLTLFYLAVVASGLAHTAMLASAVAPNDIRRLPDDKTMASTQWRGRVLDDPSTRPQRNRRSLDRTSCTLQLSAWRPTGGQFFGQNVNEPWRTASGRIACTVLGPASNLRAGDEIEFAAAVMPIAPPLIPGQLDLPTYDAARDIYGEATIRPLDWRQLGRAGSWLRQFSFAARDWAYDRLRWGLEDDPRTADFLAGMLIGYRQEIPADIEQDFRVTGTLHVFAISGQNIAEMAVVAIVLLQLVGLVRWRWAWLLAPVVLVYCMLAGSPASAVRAAVMALSVLLAWRMGRPLSALGCWSIAALAMLVWDPRVIRDPGAQLSFGVVLGLILVAPPIYRFFRRGVSHDDFVPHRLLTAGQTREEKFWNLVTALVAASIAATLVSEPITAFDFRQVTPISVLANLIVVPLAGLITVVGTVSITLSLASHALAAQCNNANWLLAKILIATVSFFAHEPGAAINVPDLRAVGAPSPLFVVAPLSNSACLLIRDGAKSWLIDTGREAPVPGAPARLLQCYGINRLDGLVLAQPDTPDNGEAASLARQFRPRRIAQPALGNRSPLVRELPEIASSSGVVIERWSDGTTVDLAPDLRIEVLGPAFHTTASRENDLSLTLLFRTAGKSILDAGRLDASGQVELLRNHPDLHADILILSQDTTLDPTFLRSLGATFWLQTPARQRSLNTPTSVETPPVSCAAWPLEQTGAVSIHFTPTGVMLTPYCSGGL